MMYQVANWFPCSSHKWTEDHQCAITGQNPRLLPQCSGSPVTGRGSDCYNPQRLIYIKHSGHEDRTIFGPLWTQVKSRRATAWVDMTVVTLDSVPAPGTDNRHNAADWVPPPRHPPPTIAPWSPQRRQHRLMWLISTPVAGSVVAGQAGVLQSGYSTTSWQQEERRGEL